jgi:L-threonylcarbamoyladenylate synthase
MILDSSEYKKVSLLIRQKEVVAFPTETVYGLAADYRDEKAMEKIFILKNRPNEKVLSAHISSLEVVSKIAKNIPEDFYLLAKSFLPGPLMIILEAQAHLSPYLSQNQTVGIRFVAHPTGQKFIEACGGCVAATSANISGEKPATSSQEVQKMFLNTSLTILDGGICQYKTASTIINLYNYSILRVGAISKDQIEKILQKKLS